MAERISVLMSLYIKERPEFLEASLQSIRQQSLPPDEVVIILDGPITSGLQQVLDKFQVVMPGLRVLPQAHNQGLGIALAIGVKACKNQLIARMDTDDIMARNRLERQAHQFASQPTLGICSSNITEFDGDIEHVVGHRRLPETDEEIRQFSKRRNPFNHMAVMFKRDAVLAAGNYQPLKGFEDYYLWARMLKQGTIAYNVQEDLVYARTGADMYLRRGGISYLVSGIKGRYHVYRAGLGKLSDFVLVSGIHVVVSLMPNQLRGWVYAKKLHA
ncbi:glycosyltransferase [Lacticaseibacillus sp. GG6-2]